MKALTEMGIRHAKPKSKIYKLSDGNGLVLLCHTNGSKYWRFNYRFAGKQKTLAMGVYPTISLSEARLLCVEFKQLLANGIDPALKKQIIQEEQELDAVCLFENVAHSWWKTQLPRWKSNHAQRILRSLEVDVFPELGNQDIRTIKTPTIMALLRKIESRNVNDTALRVLQRIKSVFNYAIQTGLMEHNPALPLTGVIIRKKTVHQLALPQDELPEFWRRLNREVIKESTRIAMKLQMLWFVRPGELRQAQWDEFDFSKREWHIPAEKMKMKRAHIVPLSDWAIELLNQLKELTGSSPYLFPNGHNAQKPMSENALSYLMARMGYKGIAVPHGFRSLASDVLNENKFDADVIERQLAHMENNKVRAAYHRTQYLPDRHEMMQWYSNWLRQFDQ